MSMAMTKMLSRLMAMITMIKFLLMRAVKEKKMILYCLLDRP